MPSSRRTSDEVSPEDSPAAAVAAEVQSVDLTHRVAGLESSLEEIRGLLEGGFSAVESLCGTESRPERYDIFRGTTLHV